MTENQTVASGDALVQLDVRDYRAQTNQVEAQIAASLAGADTVRAQQQEQDAPQNEEEPQQAEEPPEEQEAEESEAESAERDEKQEALEQWLRRVPDDPGGLLRRKFQHETKQRLRQGDYSNREQDQIW